MDFSPTPAEQTLIDFVQRGERYVVSDLLPDELAKIADPELEIRGELIREVLLGRLVNGEDPRGFQIRGARILGHVDLNNIRSSMALILEYCYLEELLQMRDATFPAVKLTGSHLPGIFADHLTTTGTVFLDGGLKIDASTEHAGLQMGGSVIGGNLQMEGASISNRHGPAIVADRIQVGSCLFLDNGFTAASNSPQGTVRFVAGKFGAVCIKGATITNGSGPALSADNVRCENSFVIGEGTVLTGDVSDNAAVRLVSAEIGNLVCEGGSVTNALGEAIVANNTRFRQRLSVHNNFSVVGKSKKACVSLQATETALLDLSSCGVQNADGPQLDLRWASARVLYLDPDGWSIDNESALPSLLVDGATYSHLDSTGASALMLLASFRSPHVPYAAQPYQHLAEHERKAGRTERARKVLIAQQSDFRRLREFDGRPHRWKHSIRGAILGYGYEAWRAGVSLLMVVTLAVGLGVMSGRIHVGKDPIARQKMETAEIVPCSLVQQIGMGVDRGLPLIRTGMSEQCTIEVKSAVGQLVTTLMWLLQLAAWALATLFVAGYLALVRKVE